MRVLRQCYQAKAAESEHSYYVPMPNSHPSLWCLGLLRVKVSQVSSSVVHLQSTFCCVPAGAKFSLSDANEDDGGAELSLTHLGRSLADNLQDVSWGGQGGQM